MNDSDDFRNLYDFESIVSHLKNEFQNESSEWYEKAAYEVWAEGAKTGDTTANIINKLYR